ncbi:hypothetical protein ZWY2020_058549 [Hordeum vulgare]|nr:hypothetical protein ZWY2020_058549 [Hordeum vulgare]
MTKPLEDLLMLAMGATWMAVVPPVAPHPHPIDPARAFDLSARMETCTLTAAGRPGKDMGFTFPLVVDNSTTFDLLRATICGKYPWVLYDDVEMRTNTRATSSCCKPPTSPSANVQSENSCSKTQAKPNIPIDPVVEEVEPDAEPLSDEEDEILYQRYTQHNIKEDKAHEYFIPAEFSHPDEDEKLEEQDNAVFGNEDEERPVMMYDRDNPSIEED